MNFDFLSPILGTLSQMHIKWLTFVTGAKFMGHDTFGNRYFTHLTPGRPMRRWVMYQGYVDASEVPPEWHAWLHHQTDSVPPKVNILRRAWQKPYVANMTGSTGAYLPPGHQLAAQHRAASSSDYQAWKPN
jgi:NADH:ubiquinone oxidoreductase subunit